jgi:hypothetical protein
MTVSSANVPRVVLVELGRSDVYRTYKVGPRILPCGTPAFIGCSSDFSFPTLTMSTTEELFERKSSSSGLEREDYGRRDPPH